MEPISPDQVQSAKDKNIPEEVIDAFNQLIVEQWDGREAIIAQEDAISRILALMGKKEDYRQTLFTNRWMDVESMFRKAGWDVEYKKPAHNENFAATYTFSK